MTATSLHQQEDLPLIVSDGEDVAMNDHADHHCHEYEDSTNSSNDSGNSRCVSIYSATSFSYTECDLDHDYEKAGEPRGGGPVEWLKSYLSSQGVSCVPQSYESRGDLFLRVTEEHVDGYDMEVSSAARRGDLDRLRELYDSGKNLQVCNRFGESIVHIASRRGNAEMLKFLMERANVSVRLCCDTGRTPLHDACWTMPPNFDSVRLLLEECPEFLLVADNRGHTPLCYVPKQCWGEWLTFLSENTYLVLPHATVEVERFL